MVVEAASVKILLPFPLAIRAVKDHLDGLFAEGMVRGKFEKFVYGPRMLLFELVG